MKSHAKTFMSFLRNPIFAFAFLAFVIGLLMLILIPIGAGWDEVSHVARDREISSGYLIPNQLFNQGPHFPYAFTQVSLRNQFIYTPVSPTFIKDNIGVKIDWSNMIDTQTRSVYSPLLSLPQAFVLGILGHIFNSSVLVMYYLCRLLELLGYILLVALAIHLIPYGKWTLAFLALAPTAVFQAATVGTDPYTNGIVFLYISWILALAIQENAINGKQTTLTVLITALLFSAKNNAYFLPLLLFLLPLKKFNQKKYFWIVILSTLAELLVLGVGWNVFAIKDFSLSGVGYSVPGQLRFILTNSLNFVAIFFKDLWINGLKYITESIAIYGYRFHYVPPLTYWLFGILLIAVILLDSTLKPISTKIRLILLGTAFVGYALTIILIYLRFEPVGSSSITEVQGRYFVLISPLIALTLIPRKKIIPFSFNPSILLWVGAISILGVFTAGIYLSYYTNCGTAYYIPGLCHLPKYKNWDPNAQFSQPVVKNTTLSQSFTADCAPLSSFQIWPLNTSGSNDQSTVFTLLDASGNVITSRNVINQNAPNQQWLDVQFPAIADSKGQQYKIVITSANDNTSKALSFSITTRHEYTQGQFLINSQPQNADLVFQYGCPVR